jgi:2-oxoglutarate ferredoxin oxidoreductase subunit delta
MAERDEKRISRGPTSGLGSAPRDKRLPKFSYERCKACGICAHFCPEGALETAEDGYPRLADPEVCSSCRLCEKICPDFAVYMSEDKGDEPGAAGGEEQRPGGADRENAEVCHLFDPCEG